jgi:uracil-DNA glycosylase
MWMGALSDVDVLIVGQDFASQQQPHTQPDLQLATNVNLLRLLQSAKIDPQRVYLTNAVLCLKPGLMSARVPAYWVKNCAAHLRRTIDIIRPRAVAALGRLAWRGVAHAFQLRHTPLIIAIDAPPQPTVSGTTIFAFAHCGGLGTAHRPLIQQERDWKRMAEWLALTQTPPLT